MTFADSSGEPHIANERAPFSIWQIFVPWVTNRPGEAVKWYRKAAELGNAEAMTGLGIMYADEQGVIEDDVEAYAWFNVAAAKGLKGAAESREKIKNDTTPEQIAEGQKRSREIMEFLTKK